MPCYGSQVQREREQDKRKGEEKKKKMYEHLEIDNEEEWGIKVGERTVHHQRPLFVYTPDWTRTHIGKIGSLNK